MDHWSRRSILAGAAGALAACSSTPPQPPMTSDWLLGQWDGSLEGQRLVVTSIHESTSLAYGSWAGEPIAIAVHGAQISFNTTRGHSVQLSQGGGYLVGTLDFAPWLRPGPRLAILFLRQVRTPTPHAVTQTT